MSADPLSLLASDDSSDSEDEDPQEQKLSNTEDTAPTDGPDKLPSPSTLFSTVGKPSFLKDPQEREIDWDRFVRNDVDSEKYSVQITEEGGYAAIPPPSNDSTECKPVYNSLSAAIKATYNKEGAGQISGAPVRYTKPEQVDPKYRAADTVGYEEHSIKTGSKRTAEPSSAEDSSNKRTKTETFRQKEKRKRDMGQSSRGKSYVEEEKRLLRQQFGTDEVMS